MLFGPESGVEKTDFHSEMVAIDTHGMFTRAIRSRKSLSTDVPFRTYGRRRSTPTSGALQDSRPREVRQAHDGR
jgi:hypothetical protein